MKVIEVKNISKTYAIGTAAKDSIIDSFRGLFKSKTQPKSTFNALTDISFEVNQGEVLGIVGKNGAGKSTLLKVLSRITEPTSGEITIRGRVASLLEVGTGFHPELSGRENIFLNGSILGMTRTEIKSKFDEIVAFSGVDKFIDTPVKHYSSGMYVRLAFSVAAHLEPEILIIDEVLAVGDAEFQKKCLGKMKDVAGQGRTVLFVSHNMAAVKSLCSRVLVVEDGLLVRNDEVDLAVEYYLKGKDGYSTSHKRSFKYLKSSSKFVVKEVGVRAKNKSFAESMSTDDILEFVIHYEYEERFDERIDFNLRFKSDDGTYIFNSTTAYLNSEVIELGDNKISMIIPAHFFAFGTYYMDFMVVSNFKELFISDDDTLCFNLNPQQSQLGGYMGKGKTFLKPRFEWLITS